jgi:DNA-binding MurR/RpiR family transcriptional regulator
VNLIADRRRRIRALGGRVSHVLAVHLVNQLNDVRPGVELLPAGSSRLLGESLGIVRSDVIIVFDYTRYQNDTVMFARQAARRGATVILVTDPFLSPAADVAAHVLTFSVVSLPPFDSPIGGFAIVESLIAGVAARLGEAGRARIQQMEALSTRWMWDESLVEDSAEGVRVGSLEP